MQSSFSNSLLSNGESFLEDQLKIRSLKDLCAIELQKNFTNDDDPNYKVLKTYPKNLQKIFFKSYTPLLTLTEAQITCAQNLLNKLNP